MALACLPGSISTEVPGSQDTTTVSLRDGAEKDMATEAVNLDLDQTVTFLSFFPPTL